MGRTTWTLKLYIWMYLAMLLTTLMLQGANLVGYRSNPTMLTVQALVAAAAATLTAFGIHLVGRVAALERMDRSLAEVVRERLTFLRGRYRAWLWACASTLLLLSWALTSWIDNADGTYRINKPWFFTGMMTVMFFGSYAVLRAAHVPLLRELRAVAEDLEAQLIGQTASIDRFKVRWKRWGYVLVALLTLLMLLGLWRALG